MKTKWLIILMLLSSAFVMRAQEVKQINSREALELMNSNPNLIVIDVRTADEFNQGHLNGAKNIDINKPDGNARIAQLDRNGVYLVYCRTRNRSNVAVEYMKNNYFKTVYQMTDGIVGWNQNGLPLK